jgi:hypothetical protein
MNELLSVFTVIGVTVLFGLLLRDDAPGPRRREPFGQAWADLVRSVPRG